jgi:hypothetical protein
MSTRTPPRTNALKTAPTAKQIEKRQAKERQRAKRRAVSDAGAGEAVDGVSGSSGATGLPEPKGGV